VKYVLFSKSAMTKIQGAMLALIIIVVGIAGVYYLSLLAPSPSITSETSPLPTPTPIAVGLIEAVADDLVEATISGDGLQSIDITLKSVSDDPLEVSISRGTIFGAQSAGVQSMVVIREEVLFLKSRGSVSSGSIYVACASMELDMPDKNDTFTISMDPASEDLIKLLNGPDFNNETFRVKQFAIWTITDNPTRHGYVGLGSFGFGSGPSDEEMGRIKILFENAGISTYKYQALNPNAPTPSPTPTPTPTPSPTPFQNIDISYTMSTKPYVVWYGYSGTPYEEYPDAGKVWLEVNMTISNTGYESFYTNPNYFYVIADGIKYTYDSIIYTLDCWDNVDILDGGTYSGTLMFQIPTSANSVSVGYERSYVTYNITWIKL